jgi:hypothetical protein
MTDTTYPRTDDTTPAFDVISAGEVEPAPADYLPGWVPEYVPPPPISLDPAALEPTERRHERAGLVYRTHVCTTLAGESYLAVPPDADRLYLIVQAAVGVDDVTFAATPGGADGFPVPVAGAEPALRLDGWVAALHLLSTAGGAVHVLTCSRPNAAPLA